MISIKRIILIVSLIGSYAVAQNTVEEMEQLPLGKLKKFGKNAVKSGDVYTAIDYYGMFCKRDTSNYKVTYKLAEQYRLARDYEKAEYWYKKTYDGDKSSKLSLFYYGQMLKSNGKYKLADEMFKKFLKEYKDGKQSMLFKKRTKVEIEGCALALRLLDSNIRVKVNHLDSKVNNAHVDCSPMFINDSTILYSSLKQSQINYFINQNNSIPSPKFFIAKKIKGNWITTDSLPDFINQEYVNNSNGTFSIKGDKFFFTRCQRNFKGKTLCAIYVSEYDGTWKEPVLLPEPINNKKFSSTQPTTGIDLTTGNEVLYFVSDNPDGKGGKDIWYSLFNAKTKTFRNPKNSGTAVNTIGDEATPFYDNESHTLFFSSTGWPTMGGYDIFTVSGELNKWTMPINIGYPLNSGADDMYFIRNKNKETGFLVSNRIGGISLKSKTCCYDIYDYKYNQVDRYIFKGTITEAHSDSVTELVKNKHLEKVQVKLYLIDNAKNENDDANSILVKVAESDEHGDFIFEYEPNHSYKTVVEKDGYFKRIESFNLIPPPKSADTIFRSFQMKIIPMEPIVIKNIYYPFDKSELTPDSRTIIDTTLFEILKNNPEIIIELSSHTDSKGDDMYNEKLSQRRAESVVNYLIDRGIPKEQLIPKGYGEKKPIALNENPDGTDNPEGRQKNRRTEFRVIGKLKHVSEIIYEE